MTFAFIFDSVGGTEWLVLLGVILIVVGPKNLPAAMRKFGQITAQLRRAADEFKRQILAMDEEIRTTVEEAVKVDDDAAAKDAAPSGEAAQTESDAAQADYYGEGNPYPGHEFYDETQYQGESEGAAAGEATAAAEPPKPAEEAAPAAEPPKPNPYAIKITVSTAAGGPKPKKKGKGAKA